MRITHSVRAAIALALFAAACGSSSSSSSSPPNGAQPAAHGGAGGGAGGISVLGGGGTTHGGTGGTIAGGAGGATSTGGSWPGVCGACVTTADCGPGSKCVQVLAVQDTLCFPTCSANGTCGAAASCMSLSSTEADQVDVCIPLTACGANGQGGGSQGTGGATSQGGMSAQGGAAQGGSAQGQAGTCGSLAAPGTTAGCASCGSSGKTCQPNGCYGGWYCNTDTNKCQQPPSSCPGGSAGSGTGGSTGTGGGTVGFGGFNGSVGPDGGTLDTLRFGIVGDTRPATIDDTSAYPTQVASQIWTDVASITPQLPFAVSTGDYMFASTYKKQAAPQLQLYLGARAAFPNVVFPAMGNHECTGATASNCGQGNPDGVTDNLTQFLGMMLQPLGKSQPYYVVNITANGGTWSAKFVFVAANAWTSDQATWLDQTLSQPTTYTFVVRHESDTANTAPGVTPSSQIIAQHPYTLKICGHAHTYEHFQKEKSIIVGNGGAPLAGTVNYGYVVAEQRSDGAIVFTAYDYATKMAIDQFAIDANGNPA